MTWELYYVCSDRSVVMMKDSWLTCLFFTESRKSDTRIIATQKNNRKVQQQQQNLNCLQATEPQVMVDALTNDPSTQPVSILHPSHPSPQFPVPQPIENQPLHRFMSPNRHTIEYRPADQSFPVPSQMMYHPTPFPVPSTNWIENK